MAAEVQVKQLPAQTVLLTKQAVTLETIAQGMGDAFHRLGAHAAATEAQFAGPPFVAYPESPDGEFEIEVCMPVAPGAVEGEGVSVEELPATDAATLLYRGPYDGMESSWQALMSWVEAGDKQPSGPPREVYLNDPGDVAPEEYLTELVVPLA